MATEKEKIPVDLVEEALPMLIKNTEMAKKFELLPEDQRKLVTREGQEQENLSISEEKTKRKRTRGLVNESKSKNAKMDEDLLGLRTEFRNNVMFVAAHEGRLEDLKYLIDQRGLPMSARSNKGESLLYFGIRSRSKEIKEYIMERADDLKLDDKESGQVVLSAFEYGDLDVIKFMHQLGVDVPAIDFTSTLPLFIASKQFDLDILKYLHLIGANFNVKDKYGQTPIHHATRCGRADVVKYLHYMDIDLNVKDKDGEEPIHTASNCGELEIIKYLHQQGVGLSVKNNDGRTPLHSASYYLQVEAVKLLHKLGADLEAVDNKKLRPREYDIFDSGDPKRKEIISYLLDVGN